MHPLLFGQVRAYPFFLALAVAVGAAAALRSARRNGVDLRRFVPALAALALGTLVGAKLDVALEVGAIDRRLLFAFRYPGAVLGFAATLGLLSRFRSTVSAPLLADLLAPSFGLGIAVARVGCFLNGCCAGAPSARPWALSFPARCPTWRAHVTHGLVGADSAASLPVHPLQLYFAASALGTGLFLLWYEPRKRFDGQLLLLFVAIQAGGKSVLELLRFPPAPHVQLLSLLLALASLTVLVVEAGSTVGVVRPSRRRAG